MLDRLERQDLANDQFEAIVVIDCAESDPAAVRAAAGARSFRLEVREAGAAGASCARNLGWRTARAPIVLFLDDDILPGRRLLAEHLAWHDLRPEVETGVLGHVRWSRAIRITGFMRWLEHGVQFDYPSIAGIEAGWGRFYTANASVKRELIARAGGFDEEHLPFGYEDLDLGYRMSKAGFRLLYNRRAEAEHLHRMDIVQWRRRVQRIARAERQFGALHPELEPYFFRMFRRAADAPAARGRGRHLIRFVPRSMPGLGRRVWRSADLYYRQALAPYFLAAWEEGSPGSSGTH